MALDKAVAVAITDIRPFQMEDHHTREDAEEQVEWVLDHFKEENHADYNPPENGRRQLQRIYPLKGHCNEEAY